MLVFEKECLPKLIFKIKLIFSFPNVFHNHDYIFC
jgi:hypothetical protein